MSESEQETRKLYIAAHANPILHMLPELSDSAYVARVTLCASWLPMAQHLEVSMAQWSKDQTQILVNECRCGFESHLMLRHRQPRRTEGDFQFD